MVKGKVMSHVDPLVLNYIPLIVTQLHRMKIVWLQPIMQRYAHYKGKSLEGKPRLDIKLLPQPV